MENNALINIIIIKPNNFQFIKSDFYKNCHMLTENIMPYLEIKEILFQDMMDTIVTTINLTPEEIGATETVFETDKHIYQLCFLGKPGGIHVPQQGNNDAETKDNNNIGKILCGEQINGNCVLIKSKINDNLICSPDSVNIDELCQIIYSKFVHIGVFVPENNNESLVEFDYFDHPIEYYNITDQDDYDNYEIKNVNFLEFDLSVVVKKDTITNNINKRMTRLFGDQIIYGDVIIISKATHEYYDLTKNMLHKLLLVAHGPLRDRKLNDNEISENRTINDLPMVMNKYIILEERYKDYKNICQYCNEELNNKQLLCGGCYRVKYDSEECRLKDWEIHKLECLYNKKNN